MDLKIKSIAWVGKNISQKFETMCQQVDNIVSQDPVKYVENQVQTMGGSVKRFCSDVVQDLLPPLVDPVKHEAQEVVLKRNDATGTYIMSLIGIEEIYSDTIIKQSCEEPHPVDHMKNQLGHAVSGLYHENQPIIPVSVDPVDGTESDLISGKTVDVLTHESSDEDVKENSIKDKSSTSEVLELMSLGESSDSNNKSAYGVVVEISHTTSVDVVDCQPTERVDTVCDNFADDSVSVSDSSNTFAASEMALSVVSCKENLSETTLMSSSNPRLMESGNLHDDSLDYITAETVLCTDSELINSSSDRSLESSEEEVSRTSYTVSLSEISRKTNGPSHDYGDDLDYSGMETIELFDHMNLEDGRVIVDNSALYAVSYRTQKLRSFKKRIQDAFASKKRLAKEYEQLAIWFGDVYMGPELDTLQNFLPATSSASLESEDSSTSHTCDSEWELL